MIKNNSDPKNILNKIILDKIAIESRRLYNELFATMSSIQNNYENKVFKKDKYSNLMERLDELLTKYKSIDEKSLEQSLIKYYEIRESLKDLIQESGCRRCSQLISIFVGYEYKTTLSEKYQKLLDFYDNFFIPTAATTDKKPPSADLPIAKRLPGAATKSFLEKIEGAEIHFPIVSESVSIIITGYFKKDPLNIMRIGGTLGEKHSRIEELIRNLAYVPHFKNGFLAQVSLRDFMICTEQEISELIVSANRDLQKYKTKPLSLLVKEFITGNTEKQRYILTLFLLSDSEDQFLAHIIYDMICNTSELLKPQPMAEEIYKSLHYTVQKLFRIAFKNMETKITQLHALTEDDIPYEKRIAMMKASDAVKTKALEKLKETKGSRESSAKAQQYLDGLLKIPFGVYKKEPVLSKLEHFNQKLGGIVENTKKNLFMYEPATDYEEYIKTNLDEHLRTFNNDKIESSIDTFLKKFEALLKTIYLYTEKLENDDYLLIDACSKFLDKIEKLSEDNEELDLVNFMIESENIFIAIAASFLELWKEWIFYKKSKKDYLEKVRKNLNDCVFGQDETKTQLERLIAQWMNGKTEGTVFGFQGPPGVGKTTIAKKGVAKCFLDEDGNSRPFGFLPMGGSSNGAILEGHSYTYMGSTWGRIVDILMETKCMNPIIYIDEIDKVSNTDHGREIIGILTHLTDFSQNHEFTDKYFAGIKFDLSKVLFIFSYNDANAIDRVLRDRITEINVKALTLNEKIHIVQDYSLPEILETVGYKRGDILIQKDTIKYIISNYTNEAGVRKIREKIFELVREINLKKITDDNIRLPFEITEEYVKELFNDKPKVSIKRIAKLPQIGFVNGLYATVAGTGGITIIECVKTPSDRKLSLELTGQQGDVMKESMMCAKTLAWNIIPKNIKKEINDEMSNFGNFGLHIHCPEAATPKDGPSAGITITTAIISRLCNIQVRNDIAMTGEIDLHGNVHAIGGLEAKLEGAKRAGVRLCLIPKENEEDYEKIIRKRGENNSPTMNGELPQVIIVSHINEVLKEAFIENDLEFVEINFLN
jgi:endopeptidase La